MVDHKAALATAKSYDEVMWGEHANLAAAYLELRELIAGYMFNDDATELAKIRCALRKALEE